MEVYKIIIHSDLEVDKSGNVKSDIGHFYVQFQGPIIKSNMEFFGKNPVKAKALYSDGSINPKYEADRNADSKKFDRASKIITKEIYVTKEQLEKAYQYAKDQQKNPEKYIGIYNDCIDFTQDVYKAAGQKGHFAQLYTAEEMRNMKSWAATSFHLPFQAYGNRDTYKAGIMKAIEDETHIFIVKEGIDVISYKEPGNISRGTIKGALDIIGFKETKEVIERYHHKKSIPALLKILNEEFAANKEEYTETAIFQKCGNQIMVEKPSIDYAKNFDISSLYDSSMEIVKGCKWDKKDENPNKSVPYEVADLKQYYGCGTLLGWYLVVRQQFWEACDVAKKNPSQIDQPFVFSRGGVTAKGNFLNSAINAYSYSYQLHPKDAAACLDLALQHTANVDMITANNAAGVNPTIFRLISSPTLKKPEIIEKFFAKGVNVNLPLCDQSKCQSALGYAIQNGDEQTVKLLLEHGANPNVGVYNLQTQIHTSPIQLAFSSAKYKLAKLLLEHNADLREGSTEKGQMIKSNEGYYKFLETAHLTNTIDEETYNVIKGKFEYFKAPYSEQYINCKEGVINELDNMQHQVSRQHEEL